MRDIKFTDKEKELLSFVVEGDANKMIAEKLNISQHTVSARIHNLIIKTGLYNRTQLAVYVVRNNIIE